MKKNLLLLLLIIAGINLSAQNGVRERSIRSNNVPAYMESAFSSSTFQSEAKANAVPEYLKSNSLKSMTSVTPDFMTDHQIGYFRDSETNEITYFMGEFVNEKEGWDEWTKQFIITFLNDDFTPSGEVTTIDMPEKTRANSVNIYTSCNSSNFILTKTHFPGDGGFADRKPEAWIVNFDGTIVKKYDIPGVVYFYKDKLILSQNETLDDITDQTLYICNALTLDILKEIEMPGLYVLLGLYDPSMFTLEIDGNDYLINAYFEKPFYVNETVSYHPEDNFLILDIYDLSSLEQVKEIKLPLEEFVDLSIFGEIEGEPGFGVVDVGIGSFPDGKWDFSKTLFNEDEKFEFIITVDYEKFVAPSQKLSRYFVYNEDATQLKKLEENILPSADYFKNLSDITGEDELVAFTEEKIEEDPEDPGYYLRSQIIRIFNLNKWEFENVSFPATFEGYQLSLNMDRIKTDDGFNYFIQTGNVSTDGGGIRSGYIVQIDKDGSLLDPIACRLPEGASSFSPIVSAGFLDPHIFHDRDNDLKFFYASWANGGQVYRIAKNNMDPMYEFGEHSDHGKAGYASFLWDKNDNLSYLYIPYEDGKYLYYNLPLNAWGTSIENPSANNNSDKIYYNASSKEINIITDGFQSVSIYSINGSLIQKTNTSNISASGWNKGVYIVALSLTDGSIIRQKILVY